MSFLKLNFGPAPDKIQFTDDLWFEVLADKFPKGANIEVPRIREAFKVLMEKFSNWPAPADFLEALPRYPTQFYITDEFPDDEKCEEGLKKIRHIIENVLKD